MYYSAQTAGFYSAEIHGWRRINTIDPSWVRPKVDIVIPPGGSAWVSDELLTNTGDKPLTVTGVPDMGAVPDTLEVDNPDCLIPPDAVEITRERYVELLDGQSAGKQISGGVDGYPMLIDPTPLDAEALAVIERHWRDTQIATTDGVVARHRDEQEAGDSTTLTAEQYTELQVYRRQLRDWPQGAEFPLAEHRPTAPPWLIGQLQ